MNITISTFGCHNLTLLAGLVPILEGGNGGGGGGKVIKSMGDSGKGWGDEKGTGKDDDSDDVMDDAVEEARTDVSTQGGKRPSKSNGGTCNMSNYLFIHTILKC